MLLYHNAVILTVDEKRRILMDGAMLINGSRIEDIGSSKAILEKYPDAERIDCEQNIMAPGLINTHMHLAQCLLRGLSDDMPLIPWLTERIWPFQGSYTDKTYLASARLGMADMLLNGTTTFVESMVASHYGMEGLVEAVDRSGMRGILSKIVMEPLPGMLLPQSMTETWEQSFGNALDAYRRWDHTADDRIRIWLGPRWTGMYNERLMDEVGRYMQEYGFYTTLHFAESSEDVETIKEATGLMPAQFLRKKGLSRKEMMLIHCTWLPACDDELLAEDGVSVAYCPISNMKLALGTCRAYDLQQAGVNMTIGTDAPAVDNNSDMFLAMRFGSYLQRFLKSKPDILRAEEMVEMATINAAKAIGMEASIGSLEIGKKADFILVDAHAPRLYPVPNPVSAFVYAATGENVKTVVVDGKTLVRERKLLSMDLPRVLEDAHRVQKEICVKLNLPQSALSEWPLNE